MYEKAESLSRALLLSVLVFCFGCATPSTTTKRDKPVSAGEKAIKAVLMEYQKAWNKQDPKGIIAFYHQNAQIMTGAERKIISTNQYIDIIPQRYEQFGSITFGVPKIKITGDKAKVKVTSEFSRGLKKAKLVFSMVKQNSRWLIMKLEY